MANPFEKINQEQTPAMDDLSVLSSSYVPENFPHREQQIDSMVKSLGIGHRIDISCWDYKGCGTLSSETFYKLIFKLMITDRSKKRL
ncbi:MAG: hypothetical protein M1402_00310 [Candidatus Thermoplasmatota archaeon]|nr:hypothetical protein [Candidatus Thermoplasmatota archaeon]